VIRFYDDWAGQRGWRATLPWRHAGGVWRARFTADEKGKPATFDVQLMLDERQTLRGLITMNESY
jgi:hypothetical protein